MKAVAKLKNLKTESCKKTILRNLHRIFDIRVIDVDIENSTILFLYPNPISFQQVRQELKRIGYPISDVKYTGEKRPVVRYGLVSLAS